MIFVACLDEKERAKELKATASRFDRAGDYEGFGKSFHTAGVGAWLCLLVVILNFMQFGSSSVSPWPAPASGCVTAARRGALDYLEEQARHCVDLPGVAPDKAKKELPDETDNEAQRS